VAASHVRAVVEALRPVSQRSHVAVHQRRTRRKRQIKRVKDDSGRS